MDKIIVYKSVFNRDNPSEFTFQDYLNNPEMIFNGFGLPFENVKKVSNISDKGERNSFKRNNLPAMDLSASNILAIDIDNLIGKNDLKRSIIDKLKNLYSCYVIKESVSGNICAFFKYDCKVSKFQYLYYKIYLELTLLLSVNIDFLPEIGRLRYIGDKGFIYKNDECEILTEIVDVDFLPKIQTAITPNDARSIKYGSR